MSEKTKLACQFNSASGFMKKLKEDQERIKYDSKIKSRFEKKMQMKAKML